MISLRGRLSIRLGLRCIDFFSVVRGNVKLGKSTYVASGAELVAYKKDKIVIGNNCFILKGVLIYPYGGSIEIGDDVSINPYCVLYGGGGLKIGHNVMIGTSCTIIPSNHSFSRTDIPMNLQGVNSKGVVIGNDVWIGSRVVILDGVEIGSGSVIGAGSVIASDVPSFSIVVGVPGKVIGKRD